MTIPTAHEPALETWNGSATRARHDYTSSEHVIAEMLHDDYFGAIHYRFRKGDIVFVTDAAAQRATFLVEDVDGTFRKVQFSILRTHYVLPITRAAFDAEDHGLTVRLRGPRGGQWCVVDKDDQIISRDHRTKKDAEDAMTLLIANRKAA